MCQGLSFPAKQSETLICTQLTFIRKCDVTRDSTQCSFSVIEVNPRLPQHPDKSPLRCSLLYPRVFREFTALQHHAPPLKYSRLDLLCECCLLLNGNETISVQTPAKQERKQQRVCLCICVCVRQPSIDWDLNAESHCWLPGCRVAMATSTP